MKEIQYHSFCLQFDDGIPEKNGENSPKNAFKIGIQKLELKLNPGLTPLGL